jgi:hypothetical protein
MHTVRSKRLPLFQGEKFQSLQHTGSRGDGNGESDSHPIRNAMGILKLEHCEAPRGLGPLFSWVRAYRLVRLILGLSGGRSSVSRADRL